MADQITFHYVKSKSFFDSPIHGVFTGINAEGRIVICPFTERMAIPQEQVYEIPGEEDGNPQRTLSETKGRDGIVRTVHGAFYTDVRGLEDLIENLQKALAQQKESA